MQPVGLLKFGIEIVPLLFEIVRLNVFLSLNLLVVRLDTDVNFARILHRLLEQLAFLVLFGRFIHFRLGCCQDAQHLLGFELAHVFQSS